MSDDARREQPAPTSDFGTKPSSRQTDTGREAAFRAARGGGSPRREGDAPQTDEQLPPSGVLLELRPLRQQFQEKERSGEQRPPDPTSAFGGTPPPPRRGEADGTTSHQIPPGEDHTDIRPLRIRFQEGDR